MTLRGDVSSQYLTALMLIGPLLEGGLQLQLSTPLVSAPYVELTAHVMAAFGADAVDVGAAQIHVPGDRYRPAELTIEPDASSASYPLAMAAVAGGRVQVRGLRRGSAQGDAAFADLLGQMGCTVTDDAAGLIVERDATTSLRGIDVDMAGTSDLVPTLAAVAVTASSPTTITGVGFIRAKESDRLGDLAGELAKTGARVAVQHDGLRIDPSPRLHDAVLATHHDHRLAMAFGVLGAVVPGSRGRRPRRRVEELAGLLGRPDGASWAREGFPAGRRAPGTMVRRVAGRPRSRACRDRRRLRCRRHADDPRLRRAVPAPGRRDGSPHRRAGPRRRAASSRRWCAATVTHSRPSRHGSCSPAARRATWRPPGWPSRRAIEQTLAAPRHGGQDALAPPAGHRVVLVSASFGAYLRPLGRRLATDGVLATELTVDDAGRCTGALLGPNCRGVEKVARLHAWLDEHHGGRGAVELWAYGDSARRPAPARRRRPRRVGEGSTLEPSP